MDPHYFVKLDPHKSGKLDLNPDPHENQISGSLRLKMEPWRASDARNGGVAAPCARDLYTSGRRFTSR